MKKRLIKEDIVSAVCKDTGFSKYTVERVINSMLDNITVSLAHGHEVQFSNFGAFKPKVRAKRTGRNPHTGEAVPIPERVVPVFEAGKKMKEDVAGGVRDNQ